MSQHKRVVLRNCFQTILLLLTPVLATAADFRPGEVAVIVGSVANVRTEPRDDASIAGQLPIGTKAVFNGSPSQIASNPNQECKGASLQNDQKWSCVSIQSLVVDYQGVNWSGWIATNLLAGAAPKLADLLVQYDKTPESNVTERRKWAERAMALEPSSGEAQERLFRILEKARDIRALEAAKLSVKEFQRLELQSDVADKQVFVYTGGYLEPIVKFKAGGEMSSVFSQEVNSEFHSRGSFYYIYSHGKQIGTVVTEAQFDCSVQKCPAGAFAKPILKKGGTDLSNGIATNFNIRPNALPIRALTEQDKATVLKMAKAWLVAEPGTPKYKEALRERLRKGPPNSLAIGTSTGDGRTMLIGNWVVGSMTDSDDSDGDIYESLLIVAEQQHDGSFLRAAGSGSISENGCSYLDHLDIDGDGVDEIVFICRQLEGQYNYAIAKRVAGKWQIPYSSAPVQ